ELGRHDLVDVEEAVLLEPDLDERGLHAGQDVVDLSEVDVAGDRAPLRPFEIHLGDLVVLEHRDALLADVDGDEQRTLRLGQRRTARRLAATALLRALPLAALRLSLRPRLRRLLLLGFLGLRLGRGGRRLLRTAAPTAATAAAAGLRRGARLSRLGGGLWGYGLGCLNGSGSLERRLLLCL